MVTAVKVCDHCGGDILALTDEWPRCAACGRDPDAPPRPPTREEKRQSKKDNIVTHGAFNTMFRDGQIVALYREEDISIEALAERFRLSKTRIQAIVKVD